MDVCFVLFLVCLYICVCVCLQIQGLLREFCSICLGTSRLPYYCTPLVCIPDVIGLLVVWLHIKPKTKNLPSLCGVKQPKKKGPYYPDCHKKKITWYTTCVYLDHCFSGVVTIPNKTKQYNRLSPNLRLIQGDPAL